MATNTKDTSVSLRDMEIDPTKTYRFELTTPHQGRFIIPRESMVRDVENRKNRKVRLSQTAESPYLDEQDEDDMTSEELIQFVSGVLEVNGLDAYKVKYLLSLDYNIDKGDQITTKPMFRYKLIDEEQVFKSRAEQRKLKLKVQNLLAEASKEDLADWLLSEHNYVAKTASLDELLDTALSYAEADVAHALKTFGTASAKLRAKLKKALEANILKEVKGIVTWADTNVEVKTFKVTANDSALDQLTKWVGSKTKEAQAFLEKLEEIL